MMAQHVMSDGMTRYQPFVGAVLITLVLGAIQFIVYAFVPLTMRSHALTYLPSMLLLGMLSAIIPNGADGIEMGFSWYVPVLILIVWWLLTRIGRLAQEVEYDKVIALFSQPMWINVLIMSLLIMMVAWMGNSNAVTHYRMKVERALLEGDIDGALKVGRKSLESDADLLMFRMYALARCNEMGEHLFEYPITGNSSDILPTNGKTKMLLCTTDSLYRFMGARPAETMEPERYLAMLQRRDSVNNKAIADYLLCGYLIDKKLDCFVAVE